MDVHGLVLNEREHTIAAAEAEEADEEERIEELQKDHRLFVDEILTVDITAQSRGDDNPDRVDVESPDEQCRGNGNPAVGQGDMGALGQCECRCGNERHHGGTYAAEHRLYPVPLHDVMEKHGDGEDDEKGG